MQPVAQRRPHGGKQAAPARFDPYRAREDFPILREKVHGKPLIYLDNAASTQKPRRNLILISFVLYAAVLVITSLYFLPELSAFRNSPGSAVSPAEWFARGQRWQHLSWLRGAVMYIGELPLLFAMSRPARAKT